MSAPSDAALRCVLLETQRHFAANGKCPTGQHPISGFTLEVTSAKRALLGARRVVAVVTRSSAPAPQAKLCSACQPDSMVLLHYDKASRTYRGPVVLPFPGTYSVALLRQRRLSNAFVQIANSPFEIAFVPPATVTFADAPFVLTSPTQATLSSGSPSTPLASACPSLSRLSSSTLSAAHLSRNASAAGSEFESLVDADTNIGCANSNGSNPPSAEDVRDTISPSDASAQPLPSPSSVCFFQALCADRASELSCAQGTWMAALYNAVRARSKHVNSDECVVLRSATKTFSFLSMPVGCTASAVFLATLTLCVLVGIIMIVL